MTRFLLIRHGESLLGSQRRYAGHEDTPLTARGRAQLHRLRSRMRRWRIHRVYASDLARCQESARILFPSTPIARARALREMDFGDWSGRTYEEIRRAEPVAYGRWLSDPSAVSPPHGEPLARVARRARRCLRRIARAHPRGTVALVTHGGVIRALLAPDLSKFWTLSVPPASVHVHLEAP